MADEYYDTRQRIVEKMTITQNADGNLAGKWERMRGAEKNTISNLKFADGKLTFTRTGKMGGNGFYNRPSRAP